MPIRISVKTDNDKPCYAILWDATTSEVYTNQLTTTPYVLANWGQYVQPLADVTGSGYYTTSLPITQPGCYLVDIWEQAGATPDRAADTEKSSGLISYDGTSEITNLEIYQLLKQLLSGGIINPNVPVTYNQITIFRGDSYQVSEGRALEWSTLNLADWPDLTGATVVFSAIKEMENEGTGIAEYSKPVTVVTPTGKTKRLQMELSAAETSAFAMWTHGYSYRIVATLANSNTVTLVSGTVTVR